jgi:hypothetical protein
MNREKVIFAFFIVLALTVNFGFFIGDIVISLIATVLKFGDRTHLGAVLLATSLVADLQLIAAAIVWGWAEQISPSGVTPHIMAAIVSLSGGAVLANITSVVMLVAETLTIRR